MLLIGSPLFGECVVCTVSCRVDIRIAAYSCLCGSGQLV